MVKPAINTKWKALYNGVPTVFKVTGIWGKGVRESYQVLSYELTPVAGGKMLRLKAETLMEWIKAGTIQWI